MGIPIFLLILIIILLVLVVKGLIKKKQDIKVLEVIVIITYLLSCLLFGVGCLFHNNEYYTAIDPVDGSCYLPFGSYHIVSLVVYFLAFNISAYLIWIKGRKLPPLVLVIALTFLFTGSIINIFVMLQVFIHNTSTIDGYKGNDGSFFFIVTPIFNLFFSIALIIKVINEEKSIANNRIYTNKFLNTCNQILSSKYDITTWALILFIPVFLLITLILILFGQDANSLVKVFTETTTWTFSQKMHPPILDHTGHYLCTVAAKGNPNIVKPLRVGTRHGNTIIVNRQLQIANAFEEMIQDHVPKLHHFIRKNYDKYGYNLSLKINNEVNSNRMYLLMKPLEWCFLTCLYLGCVDPEKKIAKQYQ